MTQKLSYPATRYQNLCRGAFILIFCIVGAKLLSVFLPKNQFFKAAASARSSLAVFF